ncbi:MAG: hypothetical protein J3K34DRAFT_111950 [Monoraphidium minutum]|nr:MAG: hypothetical protein J3K34DRAFT_111950 [Monoraphidium minutum]
MRVRPTLPRHTPAVPGGCARACRAWRSEPRRPGGRPCTNLSALSELDTHCTLIEGATAPSAGPNTNPPPTPRSLASGGARVAAAKRGVHEPQLRAAPEAPSPVAALMRRRLVWPAQPSTHSPSDGAPPPLRGAPRVPHPPARRGLRSMAEQRRVASATDSLTPAPHPAQRPPHRSPSAAGAPTKWAVLRCPRRRASTHTAVALPLCLPSSPPPPACASPLRSINRTSRCHRPAPCAHTVTACLAPAGWRCVIPPTPTSGDAPRSPLQPSTYAPLPAPHACFPTTRRAQPLFRSLSLARRRTPGPGKGNAHCRRPRPRPHVERRWGARAAPPAQPAAGPTSWPAPPEPSASHCQ